MWLFDSLLSVEFLCFCTKIKVLIKPFHTTDFDLASALWDTNSSKYCDVFLNSEKFVSNRNQIRFIV